MKISKILQLSGIMALVLAFTFLLTSTGLYPAIKGTENSFVGVGHSRASAQEPADLNNDSIVDIYDLALLIGRWNTVYATFDLNASGPINIYDLSILLSRWGPVATGWTPRFPGDPQPGKMYYGASVEGGNPSTFEAQIGQKLTIFRSYMQADDAPSKFVSRATDDINNKRIPLVSTKVPNNDWAGVGRGAFDSWLLDRIRALDAVPGPVWLCLHHEPYGDGVPADWVKMQQRARQLIDTNSDNIALVGILNGYDFTNQNRDPTVWRHPVGTGVHIMGYDSYNPWFPPDNNTWRLPSYVFSPGVEIATWGYPTLVGEYGVRYDPNNPGKAKQWMLDAYSFALANNFTAISYFNSGANSPDGPWTLDGERLDAFKTNLSRPETARIP